MIDQETTSERRIGMNINLKDLGDLGLQELRQDLLPGAPEVVSHAVGLEGVKALEIQEHVGHLIASGIAVPDGHHVGSEGSTKDLVVLECIENE